MISAKTNNEDFPEFDFYFETTGEFLKIHELFEGQLYLDFGCLCEKIDNGYYIHWPVARTEWFEERDLNRIVECAREITNYVK